MQHPPTPVVEQQKPIASIAPVRPHVPIRRPEPIPIRQPDRPIATNAAPVRLAETRAQPARNEPEKLGQKIGSEIEPNPKNNPIFHEPQPAPQAKTRKKTKIYRKRGRQRTKEQVKRLFIIWRITRGYWPTELDYEMCLYYTQHYIRKDGKFHDIFLQWKAEAEAATGKKFRVNPAIQPGVPRPRSKVLRFPSERAAGEH